MNNETNSTAQQAAESIEQDADFMRKLGRYWQTSTEESKAALVAHINAWGRPATSHEGKVEASEPTDISAQLREYAAIVALLREALDKLIDVAAACDSWQSFPRAALNEANAALSATDRTFPAPLDMRANEAKRLRRVINALGMGSEVPDKDDVLRDCLFAVLGQVALKLEKGRAPERSETPADERTRHFEEQPDGTIHDIEPTVSSSAAPSDERAAFVAWGQAGHTFLDDERNDAGVYVSSSTRLAWMAWQARARTTPSVQAVAAPGQEQAAGNSDSLANWLRNQIGAGPVTMTRGDAFALVNALDSYQAALVEWTKPAASPVELTDADDEARIMEMELALYRDAYGAKAPSEALVDVIDERQRQVSVKDWSHEHDDAHPNGEIAAFAAVYAMPPATRDWLCVAHMGYGDTLGEALCPEGWTPNFGERRRELVKAGALILAEIERLDRASHLSGDTAAQGGE